VLIFELLRLGFSQILHGFDLFSQLFVFYKAVASAVYLNVERNLFPWILAALRHINVLLFIV
jgi:hypothetical protein